MSTELLNGYGILGVVPGIVSASSRRRIALMTGPNRRYSDLQAAVTAADPGDTILVDPASYEGQVIIPRTKNNLVIVGMGGRGSVALEADETTSTLINHADDVTIVNIGAAGDGSGGGLRNMGSRFRAFGCKFEGGTIAAKLTLGTAAEVGDDDEGNGADVLFDDCEFAWATHGVSLVASDYGAITQAFFSRCRFHNLDTDSFNESGGSAGVRFRNLHVADCIFDTLEDGTVPTKWFSLNADNGNTGIVTRCSFPTAINSGKNLVSTKLLWIGNFHTGGIAGAQPS